MVNYQVGYKLMDDFTHYFVNGLPVYCHEKEDKNGYHIFDRLIHLVMKNKSFFIILRSNNKTITHLPGPGKSQISDLPISRGSLDILAFWKPHDLHVGRPVGVE